MDAFVPAKAEQLASKFAGEAKTAEALNSLMLLIIKSAMGPMVDTETDVHIGRRENIRNLDGPATGAVGNVGIRDPSEPRAENTAWRTRQLDGVWPTAYFDEIVVHVRGANSAMQAN